VGEERKSCCKIAGMTLCRIDTLALYSQLCGIRNFKVEIDNC
jgi:hypothetical protein